MSSRLGMLSQLTWGEYDAYGTPTSVATSPPPGEAAGTSPDWMTNLTQIVGAVTQYDLARKLYDLNLTRVQQGLEPISSEQVSPSVNVGLSSDTRQLVMIGIAVVAGLFLFKMMAK